MSRFLIPLEVAEQFVIMGLTDKQKAFVNEYLLCLNATRAAIRAGYSKKTAHSMGSENLRKPEIKNEIDRIMRENTMQADEVLFRITEIAKGDIADVVDPDSETLDLMYAISQGKSHLIKKSRRKKIRSRKDDTETEIIEFEMYDKQRALETLAKYHDLTNKIRIDDWRVQAIDDIKRGAISFNELAKAFDKSLAEQLFQQAGVPINEPA